MSPPHVLVTGATGKTGRSLVDQLRGAGVAVRPASRGSEILFDWTDPATWGPALVDIDAVYLVAPPTVSDPYSRLIQFLEAASDRPMRFVFLGISSLPAGDLAHGRVHQWLLDHADDWAVLRPSAFLQNFSEGPFHASILDEDAIYSNTGTGRVGFIDAHDIARSACCALTSSSPLNADYVLTGPEALSFDQVAAAISAACGRTITHTNVDDGELAERFERRGIPELNAGLLAAAYSTIAGGSENFTTSAVGDLTGQPATTLGEFVTAHADAWRHP